MPAQPPNDFTALLAASGKGDAHARNQLFSLIYDQLHDLASAFMNHERKGHTLQPTALVNEAFLRLLPASSASSPSDFNDRRHFFAAAALAMRRILINHARARLTEKRNAGRPLLALDDLADAFDSRAHDLLALDDALTQLAQLDPLQVQVVELRFFAGLTVDQCALTLGISPRSVHDQWSHARAWLRATLQGSRP